MFTYCREKAGQDPLISFESIVYDNMGRILALSFTVFLASWCANAVYDNERFDCTPGIEPNEATCRGRGCVWKDSLSNTVSWPISVLVVCQLPLGKIKKYFS